MVKKKGLGKGLGALLSDENSSIDSDSITEIKIVDIEPNSGQPRKTFDEEDLSELSASIKEHGVITPILVHESDNGYYRIIAGERRWRAYKGRYSGNWITLYAHSNAILWRNKGITAI